MIFDYSKIPDGFYDKIFDGPNGLRKFWHWHKFNSVVRNIVASKRPSKLLDIGTFSGTFAGRFLDESVFKSTSIDILESQIAYAKTHYESENKKFIYYKDFSQIKDTLNGETFDVVTFIEVIEHLNPEQIREFFELVAKLTHSGSQVLITTPNYVSIWPLLEFFLNKISDVKYEEQHITKFSYWNIFNKLIKICPQIKSQYKVSLLTTSHFISPFISMLSYSMAKKLSIHYPSDQWNNPFGSIVILKLEKI